MYVIVWKFDQIIRSMQEIHLGSQRLVVHEISESCLVSGEQFSPLFLVNTIESMYDMYINEFVVKKKIVDNLRFRMLNSEIVAYIYIWQVQPYLDKKVLAEVSEKFEFQKFLDQMPKKPRLTSTNSPTVTPTKFKR
eukprot:TRINITY_DN13953_c0_g1_i1.p1 TRINITY_DN13953_c0_g1~~TRINITY_DN13953_c0_g1_i1.p1  ORF type:complete len:136 (-),score=18.43 TRINITY_DN13953_c0_g1_i1:135-542(-)